MLKQEPIWKQLAALAIIAAVVIHSISQGGWYGPVAAVALIGFVAWTWFTATSEVLDCTAAGFSVTSKSFRDGATERSFRWEEVTSTEYSRGEGYGEDSSPTVFEVRTTREQAFSMFDSMSAFGEVIEVFNTMTPHLPYIWKAQSGGWSTTYERVERAAAAAAVVVTRTNEEEKEQRPPVPPLAGGAGG